MLVFYGPKLTVKLAVHIMVGIQFLSSICTYYLMVTISLQRGMNTAIHDEITLIGKYQINAVGRIWQNMFRFTNKLT